MLLIRSISKLPSSSISASLDAFALDRARKPSGNATSETSTAALKDEASLHHGKVCGLCL